MSTAQERPLTASGKLSTVRGLSQARMKKRTGRRRVEQVASRPPAASAGLPELVKRVQSYLEVGRT
jgi:hypothetical protein